MGKKQEEKHDDREENVFDVDICFTNESFFDRKKTKKILIKELIVCITF